MNPGDRVAIMLDPSRAFYVAMFGALKAGAIAVPLFTLFGPDGVRLRVQDCAPVMLVTNRDKVPNAPDMDGLQTVVFDAEMFIALRDFRRLSPRRRRTAWRSSSTRPARHGNFQKR